MPRLTVVIGANGAGKSTWHASNAHRLQTPFFDPDAVAAGLGDANDPHFQRRAAEIVSRETETLLAALRSFGFESTYAGRSRPNLVRRAHEAGYRIGAVFLSTDHPFINIKRIHRRFLAGGHAVPGETVIRRWERGRANLIATWDMFDEVDLIDASVDAPRHIASKLGRDFILHVPGDGIPVGLRPVVRRAVRSRAGAGPLPRP